MNTNTNTKLILLAVAMFLPITGCATLTNAPYNAVVTVRIVDDEGSPIEGANAKFFSMLDSGSPVLTSDTNGIASRLLTSIFGEIDGDFAKSGYYKTSGVFWKQRQSVGLFVPPAGTNFTIVLKRIINPVPMKRKEVTAYSPRQGEPVGFDLEIGDWVFPDGKGKVADILVMATRRRASNKDFSYSLKVEFPGEHNGIQSYNYHFEDYAGYPLRSDLPPPQVALEEGYEKVIEHFSKRSPSDRRATNSRNDNLGRTFRVRTVVDEHGNIIAANYGWSVKDIYIAATSDGSVGFSFIYYYNPDPKSRSLEPKEIAGRQEK